MNKPLLHAITDSTGNVVFVWKEDTVDVDGLAGRLFEEQGRLGMAFADFANPHLLQLSIRVLRMDANPSQIDTLINLARALADLFTLLSRPEHIEEAILLYKTIFAALPSHDPDHITHKQSLAKALRLKYKHLGVFGDLEQSMTIYRHTLQLTPKGHDKRSEVLNSLAETLICRYDELRQLDDLDSAIALLHMAINDNPVSEDYMRPYYMKDLASALSTRYTLLKALQDVDEAIQLYRQAKPIYTIYPDVLVMMGLATSLLQRAQRDLPANSAQVDEAISSLDDALALAPYPNSHRPKILEILSKAYIAKFRISRDVSHADSSIHHAREAITSLQAGSPGYLYRINLADALRAKFEHSPSDPLITEATQLCHAVLAATPSSHPEQAVYYSTLGRTLLAKYHHANERHILDEAIDSYRSAALAPTGLAGDRFTSAREWARIADDHAHDSALEAYRRAISLLHDLSLVGMEVQHRYLQLMAHDTTLASDAAAYAIGAGRFQEAVEFLESGKGILWNQSASLRSPLDELRAAAPALSREFEVVCRELERGGHGAAHAAKSERELGVAVDRQRALAKQREDLLAQIRTLPSFETFLLPTPFAQLRTAAACGPVILINAARTRCDALLILPGNEHVRHLPLPNTDQRTLAQLHDAGDGAGTWRHLKRIGTTKTADRITATLALLWSSAVAPILKALDEAGYGRGTRVWWCTSGAFTGLPLHASGLTHGPNCLDAVISSYTPTLAALLRARQSESAVLAGIPQLLALAQPDTPGLAALPFASEEMECIRRIVPAGMRKILEGDSASLRSVSGELLESSWLHLACHGSQNLERPFESCFYLHDGALTLEALMELQQRSHDTPQADFAFLTACHTASSESDSPDEAVHLASGLQFAGFRSVIGTMWAIADEDGPFVASKVYEHLFRDADFLQQKPKSTDAAEALNLAQRALRDAGTSPRRWAAFVHIGV